MGITIAIVSGVIIVTVISAYFDYLGKKSKNASPQLSQRLQNLEKRLESLESALSDKDEKIRQLEEEVSFVNRLLDKKD